MARVLRVLCLMVIVLACGWKPAEARNPFLDWMEELSGPGPFRGWGGFVATICFGGERFPGRYSEDIKKPCAYFDFRKLEAEENDNFLEFGEVGATAYDFGATWQLYRPIELGVGMGFVRFAANDVSTTRMTLTAPRLVIKPLLLIPGSSGWGKWTTILKLYARENIILGNLQATDFGVAPGRSTFNVDNDKVTSFGVLFDLTDFWRP